LADLLGRIGRSLPGGFPNRPSANCLLSVEECPDGDRASRVDIQADDPAFYLVIEIKIDASEQPGQVARYCDLAAARAANVRPWAVVFLTIDGRPPATAGDWADRVVAVSWTQVAASLRQTARRAAPVPHFLAASFATHISNL
jgi:PD-(D/E)XK nuclease superfamily